MSREFKQTFFTSLLTVLLILSNFLCLKLTSFLELTISCDFLTYPFTFLCTLLILNLGGKKSAYRALIVSVLIQLFTTISLTLAVNLGTQGQIPDLAMHINQVFKVNELNLIASVISFLASHCALIYIYDNFKRNGKELYGVVLGLLGSLVLNAVIFIVITLHNQDIIFIINSLLSNIIISIIMIVIITVLYFILKEKEIEAVEINSMNIDVNKYTTTDMSIEDVMIDRKKQATNPKKSSFKETSENKKVTKKTKTSNQKGKGSKNYKRNENKSKKTSKNTVNRKDN